MKKLNRHTILAAVLFATLVGMLLVTSSAAYATTPPLFNLTGSVEEERVGLPPGIPYCYYEGMRYSEGAIIENPDGSFSYCHDGEWLPYLADEDENYQVLPWWRPFPSEHWTEDYTFVV
jgi:hypothetical protein